MKLFTCALLIFLLSACGESGKTLRFKGANTGTGTTKQNRDNTQKGGDKVKYFFKTGEKQGRLKTPKREIQVYLYSIAKKQKSEDQGLIKFRIYPQEELLSVGFKWAKQRFYDNDDNKYVKYTVNSKQTDSVKTEGACVTDDCSTIYFLMSFFEGNKPTDDKLYYQLGFGFSKKDKVYRPNIYFGGLDYIEKRKLKKGNQFYKNFEDFQKQAENYPSLDE